MHMPPKPFMARAKKMRMDRSGGRGRESHVLLYNSPVVYMVLMQQG